MAKDGPSTPTMFAKLVAEFIGTFTLVFTACNNNMAGNQLASLSVACSLMVGVYALGSVSGANFNPAVTLSLLLAELSTGHGDMGLRQAALYWLVQLAAGLSAGMFSGFTWTTTLFGATSTVSNSTEALAGALLTNSTNAFVGIGAKSGYGLGEVFVAEMLFTALLCFVVLSVATCNDTKGEKNYYFGLAIGLTVAAGAVSIGHISGCSMNPAVSFGVSMSDIVFGTGPNLLEAQIGLFFFYTLAELVGAAVGYGFFAACRLGHALPSKLCAEFIGTFYLVMTVCFVVGQGASAPLAGVIGIASVLMACIYSTAAVSGGNLNPAVSFGLLITGEKSGKEFGLYVLVQIIAGLAAVGIVCLLLPWHVTLVQQVVTGYHAPPQIHFANGSWGAVAVAEFFYSFLLVFVVLNVAVRDAGNQYYGLAIGFVVIVGGVCVGGLSGGCFNPAIALSVDFGSLASDAPGNQYGYGFLYALFELAGGAAAAGVFKLVSKKEEEQNEDSDTASDMS